MMIKKALFLFVFLFGCFFCNLIANASVQKEEILSYHIDATLNQDSSLLVEETIKVRALGKDIKRGIYRDFPLKHAGGKTPVFVMSVTRNGQHIPHNTQMQNGQKRVYLGDMNKYIPSGVYEYKIKYKYQNIIRQNNEKTKDEFYYNLIGNEWMFNSLDVKAIIRLPAELKMIETPKVFTGKYGSKNQVTSFLEQGNQISIHLPNGLKKQEALTLRTVFNSGFFPKMKDDLLLTEKLNHNGLKKQKNTTSGAAFNFVFFQKKMDSIFLNKKLNYFCILIVFISFLLLGFYAYTSWKKYGQDGIIKPAYPRFDIPKFGELSALFLLWRFHQSNVKSIDLIMPHLAHLSQRGLLKIQVSERDIVLKKMNNIAPENDDEKFFIQIAEEIYCLEIDEYDPSFAEYVKKYKKHAEKTSEKLIKKNDKKRYIFTVWMFLNCLVFFLLYFKNISYLFVAGILIYSIFVVSGIILDLVKRNQGWVKDIFEKCVRFLMVIAGFSWISTGDFRVLRMLADTILNFNIILFILLFSCIIALYKYVIVRIYDRGLGLIEHLKGIEMFLDGVDDLKHQTPEQAEMEKLLPYAILLGMHNKWCERMEIYFNFTPPKNDVFGNKTVFSSITSSLQSSATPPSNDGGSSGFSGGGRSGGGSGGGGGGGF